MPSRGILYVTWGQWPNAKLEGELKRSRESLAKFHPDLPVHHARIETRPEDGFLGKSAMYDLSPFDETLYLDCDTIVMGNLDFAFEQSARHGVACCICEAPWARRYIYALTGDLPEYNCGVIWFTKRADTQALFAEWQRLAYRLDWRVPYVGTDGRPAKSLQSDQGPFSMAVHKLGFNPYVLPQNWNFRARWQRLLFGPVKIWHDHLPPPGAIVEATRLQSGASPLGFTEIAPMQRGPGR